ncbi:unnamed protein product, partial [Ectocarpus sp. 12 AP-2014]
HSALPGWLRVHGRNRPRTGLSTGLLRELLLPHGDGGPAHGSDGRRRGEQGPDTGTSQPVPQRRHPKVPRRRRCAHDQRPRPPLPGRHRHGPQRTL